MKEFKEFGIKPITSNFTGDKIKVEKIINKQIVVYGFIIKDSTKKANTKCLHLQISLEDEKRVVFTGGSVLMETIQRVPVEDFPFKTTIVKENDRFEFR